MTQQQSAPPPPRHDGADALLLGLSARDIRLLRQVRGFTQADVAKRAGFSISKLSNLESGKEPIAPDYEVRLVRALWP